MWVWNILLFVSWLHIKLSLLSLVVFWTFFSYNYLHTALFCFLYCCDSSLNLFALSWYVASTFSYNFKTFPDSDEDKVNRNISNFISCLTDPGDILSSPFHQSSLKTLNFSLTIVTFQNFRTYDPMWLRTVDNLPSTPSVLCRWSRLYVKVTSFQIFCLPCTVV